ncbi:hypothetical protein QAD02_002987 [Eretmocerus hayati]|uniref:Uncharacterized protein n=1 Tax=Eretmocerus hayati TaxID=131215 RepID=A0ACC2NLG2_9HYME|nr:hypothetical protein QAD02_002987 [Eretmocerus hayati]
MNTRSRHGGTHASNEATVTTPVQRSRTRGQRRSTRNALPMNAATVPNADASQPANLTQEETVRRLREDEKAQEQRLHSLRMQIEATPAWRREQRLNGVRANSGVPRLAQREQPRIGTFAGYTIRASQSDSSSVLQQLAALHEAVARIGAQSGSSSQISDRLESMIHHTRISSGSIHEDSLALPSGNLVSTPAPTGMLDAVAVRGTSGQYVTPQDLAGVLREVLQGNTRTDSDKRADGKRKGAAGRLTVLDVCVRM